MKRITVVLAAVAIGCFSLSTTAIAHDVSIVAAVGALESEVNELQAEVNQLKARLNIGQNEWNQNDAVSDLYSIVDRIAEQLSAAGDSVKREMADSPETESDE